MPSSSPGSSLTWAIRLVSVLNLAWAAFAGVAGNWTMMAIQLLAAAGLWGASLLLKKTDPNVRSQARVDRVRPASFPAHAQSPEPASVRGEDWGNSVDIEPYLEGEDAQALRELIRSGVDPNSATDFHESLLEEAIEFGASESILHALLDEGASADVDTVSCSTLLGMTVGSGEYSLPLMLRLIPGGIPSPNSPPVNSPRLDQALREVADDVDEDWRTSAILAGWLVAAGANPMARDEDDDETALGVAVDAQATLLMKYMLWALPPEQRLKMVGWVDAMDEELCDRLDLDLHRIRLMESAWEQGLGDPDECPRQEGASGEALAERLRSLENARPQDHFSLLLAGAPPVRSGDNEGLLDWAARHHQEDLVAELLQVLPDSKARQWLDTSRLSEPARERVRGLLGLFQLLRARHLERVNPMPGSGGDQ